MDGGEKDRGRLRLNERMDYADAPLRPCGQDHGISFIL